MAGYVYLFENRGLYKIGLTTQTIQARLNQLNRDTGSDGMTKIVAYAEVEYCESIERTLHKKYDAKRLYNPSGRKNEWFKLDEFDVLEVQNELEKESIGDCHTPDTEKYKAVVEKKRIAEKNIEINNTRKTIEELTIERDEIKPHSKTTIIGLKMKHFISKAISIALWIVGVSILIGAVAHGKVGGGVTALFIGGFIAILMGEFADGFKLEIGLPDHRYKDLNRRIIAEKSKYNKLTNS